MCMLRCDAKRFRVEFKRPVDQQCDLNLPIFKRVKIRCRNSVVSTTYTAA